MGSSPKWMVYFMEKSQTRMDDDLGVALFQETSVSYTQSTDFFRGIASLKIHKTNWVSQGTQVIDRTWGHMKSYIPRNLSSRRLNVTGTTAALMKHCLIWQWLHEVLAPGYSLWDQLGKLCKEHNHKVGLWRLA